MDFNNQKTGNWSWYYHLDNANLNSAISGNGFSQVPGFGTTTPSRAQQFVMSNTKTLGATAVNEARFSVFRNVAHIDNPAASFADLATLGFVTGPARSASYLLAGYKTYLPQISFSGNTGLNIGVPTLNTFQPNTTYMVSDVFSKSMGRHTWKFGGEFRYLQVNERNFASPNGQFIFDGTVTGSDVADFLLGATSTSVPMVLIPKRPCNSSTRGHVTEARLRRTPGRSNPTSPSTLACAGKSACLGMTPRERCRPAFRDCSPPSFPGSPTGLVFPGDPGIPKDNRPDEIQQLRPAPRVWPIRLDSREGIWARSSAARAKPVSARHTVSTTHQLRT